MAKRTSIVTEDLADLDRVQTTYEWVAECWDGHPDRGGDVVDAFHAPSLVEAAAYLPVPVGTGWCRWVLMEAVRDPAASASDSSDRGVWWTISLWRSRGSQNGGLLNRWEAYAADLNRERFPGCACELRVPQRYLREFRAMQRAVTIAPCSR